MSATYDPKKVLINFGTIEITGYADGTFVEIEPEGDSFERVTGSAGDVVFVNKQMWVYNVTITLLQTSHTNAELTLWHNADKLSNNGLTSLQIKDLRGNSLFTGNARIGTEPTVTWSRDIENREWTFITESSLNNVGGSN